VKEDFFWKLSSIGNAGAVLVEEEDFVGGVTGLRFDAPEVQHGAGLQKLLHISTDTKTYSKKKH